MTVTNPFTLAVITVDERDTPVEAPAAQTPYATLCADGTRPAAFALTFVEPAAA